MDQTATGIGFSERKSYWNQYYGSRQTDLLPLPSQFAAFVAGEIDRNSSILDIGCGSGRDSFFFAANGIRTLGIDASEAAVRNCVITRDRFQIRNVQFLEASLSLLSVSGPVSVYARFLLHAITEDEETMLLNLAVSICRSGGIFATEFRTIRDASQVKVTPDHYRRFLDPLLFLQKVQRFGFTPKYYVEGFGFAKHKNDDAYVARCLLQLN